MPKAARLGDSGSGHACFPPSPAIQGSSDIIINGKPAVRKGDAYAAHGCKDCKPHGRSAAQGSSTVNFNGKPAVRVGDGISCGGSAQTGSSNVFIGATTWSGIASSPETPILRLLVSNIAGASGSERPYPQEPYKLYKDGALDQEGVTDDDGLIEYEYEAPWESELKIETMFGEYTYTPVGLQPSDSTTGVKQRLGLLGYHDQYHDEKLMDEVTTSKPSEAELLGDQQSSDDSETEINKAIRTLIP